MHSSRVGAFLLGAWMGCSLFLSVLAVQNVRFAGRLAGGPISPAAQIINDAGPEQAKLLLRHFAWEQNRFYFTNWEMFQMPVAVILALFLYLTTDRRILPPILCGLMLALVMFEYFAITPEFIYRGREADFPPGSLAFGAEARVWVLAEVLIGAEAAKLLVGGVLASYLFTYRTRRRVRKIDDPADVKLSPLRG
ncbi:MAG TPA: hypothetical protein VK687_06600 [Bryobacteraceae bacterium]|nr:hypothetical protein [Bryobacteraceae bacterium]